MNIIDTFDSIHVWRDPDLIRQKRLKMSENPVAFFRWSNHLFYQYMMEHLDVQSPWWRVCGDLHVENFGTFRWLDNQVYFDINDFDEANWWQIHRDLTRLMTSIAVVYHTSWAKPSAVSQILHYTQRRYISMLLGGKIGSLTSLDDNTSVQKHIEHIVDHHDQHKFIDDITDHDLLKRSDNFIDLLPSQYALIEKTVEELLRHIRGTKIIDIAKHIMGNSSLWLDRYVVLIKWVGKHHCHLLDIKQASLSVLSSYHTHITRTNQAQRIVSIQKMMQSNSPLLLSTIQVGDQSFILKELQAVEDKIALDPHDKVSITHQLIDEMVYALVRSQLSSCDMGGSVTLIHLMDHAEKLQTDESIISFVWEYINYNKQSYQQFCEELFDI